MSRNNSLIDTTLKENQNQNINIKKSETIKTTIKNESLNTQNDSLNNASTNSLLINNSNTNTMTKFNTKSFNGSMVTEENFEQANMTKPNFNFDWHVNENQKNDVVREELVKEVNSKLTNLECWYNLLSYDLNNMPKEEHKKLIHLFEKATKIISDKNNKDIKYQQIWLKFATIASYISYNESRAIFKRIVNLKFCFDNPDLFILFAQMEIEHGSKEKAKIYLTKGEKKFRNSENIKKCLELYNQNKPISEIIVNEMKFKENKKRKVDVFTENKGDEEETITLNTKKKKLNHENDEPTITNPTDFIESKEKKNDFVLSARRRRGKNENNIIVNLNNNINNNKEIDDNEKLLLKLRKNRLSNQSPNDIEAEGKVSVKSNEIPNSEKKMSLNQAVEKSNEDYETKNASVMRTPKEDLIIKVNDIEYTIISIIGKGGSSKVYRAFTPEKEIVALKKVKLSGVTNNTRQGFLNEVSLLKKLKGKPNIIQIIDSEINKEEKVLYLVIECGDIDLNKMLQIEKEKGFNLNKIKLYWQQILEVVQTIHEEKIIHSDLKPANFLLVKGYLKLIDFGIANSINSDTTNILRDKQVGTVSYMSPETLNENPSETEKSDSPKYKIGRSSDIWSLGCILYQMTFGKTPFSHLNLVQTIHAITDEKYEIKFDDCKNEDLLDVLKKTLQRNPKDRPTIPELLEHPFLKSTFPVAPLNNSMNEIDKNKTLVCNTELEKLIIFITRNTKKKNEYIKELNDCLINGNNISTVLNKIKFDL
jgi:serine/threonine-protein kinase TTK/MPS1